MSEIGTAEIRIKPALDEAALELLCNLIEARVTAAIEKALNPRQVISISQNFTSQQDPYEVARQAAQKTR